MFSDMPRPNSGGSEKHKDFGTFSIDIPSNSNSFQVPTDGKASLIIVNLYNKSVTSNTYCYVADANESTTKQFGKLPTMSGQFNTAFTNTEVTFSRSSVLSSNVYNANGYIYY